MIRATRVFRYQTLFKHPKHVRLISHRYQLSGSNDEQNCKNNHQKYLGVSAFGAATLGFALPFFKKQSRGRNSDDKETVKNEPSRVITRREVAEHSTLAGGVWITYQGNVYDITEFVQHHPGGSHTIMMGAGGDVEAFWKTYTVHEAVEVQKLLAKFQIGVLTDEDQALNARQTHIGIEEGPYANDPQRSSLLQVLSQAPFNAETPSKLLVNTFLTPNEIFFVRNHLPVPEVDLDNYTLSISLGTDGDPDNQRLLAEFTLDDLKKKFEPHTIDCIIQCSGNRRHDLKSIKEIKGLDWQTGAIGNARWTGVKLVDVLDSLGLKKTDNMKHVQLEGLDCDMSGQAYSASISADVAFDPAKDVLLAFEMNGQPLSRDHGFPLRFVAPGITGARNVKWLSKIIISDEESTGHWQRNDYKSFSPSVDMFNVNYKQSISIQEMPVQSAICNLADGDEIQVSKSQRIPIRGFAYSGGGKAIVRVDVSLDGGENWMTAELLDQPKNPDGSPDFSNRNQVWSWTRWALDAPVPESVLEGKQKDVVLMCRAFDSAYNSQPERAETIWNVRGVVNNSWHRVRLHLKLGSD